LRRDFGASQLRGLAKKTKDGPQARRLLALAAIYDGATRSEAAKIGGVGLQIIRDWVLHASRSSRLARTLVGAVEHPQIRRQKSEKALQAGDAMSPPLKSRPSDQGFFSGPRRRRDTQLRSRHRPRTENDANRKSTEQWNGRSLRPYDQA
jgi:hypothetical protein